MQVPASSVVAPDRRCVIASKCLMDHVVVNPNLLQAQRMLPAAPRRGIVDTMKPTENGALDLYFYVDVKLRRFETDGFGRNDCM